jgi:hypothetical protein
LLGAAAEAAVSETVEMDWLVGTATTVGGWIILLLVAGVAGEALHPLIRHVYSPPHGAYTLVGTWLTAVAAVGLAIMRAEWSVGLRSAVTLLPLVAALFGSFIYRDERRRVRGLPEVVTVVPDRFGWRGRMALALLAVVAVGTAGVSVWTDGWQAWVTVLGSLLIAVVTVISAITGRMPDVAVAFLGARRQRRS